MKNIDYYTRKQKIYKNLKKKNYNKSKKRHSYKRKTLKKKKYNKSKKHISHKKRHPPALANPGRRRQGTSC